MQGAGRRCRQQLSALMLHAQGFVGLLWLPFLNGAQRCPLLSNRLQQHDVAQVQTCVLCFVQATSCTRGPSSSLPDPLLPDALQFSNACISLRRSTFCWSKALSAQGCLLRTNALYVQLNGQAYHLRPYPGHALFQCSVFFSWDNCFMA